MQVFGTTVNLSRTDVRLILKTLDLSPALHARLEASESEIVHLSPEDAREIGDAATLRLAQVGFDENYDLTPEGRELERLIDRVVT